MLARDEAGHRRRRSPSWPARSRGAGVAALLALGVGASAAAATVLSRELAAPAPLAGDVAHVAAPATTVHGGLAGALPAHAGAATSTHAQPAGTVVLADDVPPATASLVPVGEPSPSQVIHLGIGLSGRDPAGLSSLVSAMYSPASPNYHHFLSRAQYAARFAPTEAQSDATLAWLRSGGMDVSLTTASRNYVQATGTVGAVERLLGVAIHEYRQGGTSFSANATAPRVPASLGINAVLGLDSLQRFSTFSHLAPAAGPPLPVDPTHQLLSPQDLWSAYDEPAGNTGQGQTLAILGEGQTQPVVDNLRRFETEFHLPATPVNTVDVGAGPFDDDSQELEWDLDTQASTGMAPRLAREDLYFAASMGDADIAATIAQWAADDIDLQANASFGECELGPELPSGTLETTLEPILQEAVAQGQTLFAATGDEGSFCFDGLPPGVDPNGTLYTGDPRMNYPAVSPETVAVGGTVVYVDGSTPPQRGAEIAWSYTGGGSSPFIPAPQFQQGVSAITGRCVASPSGSDSTTGAACRGVPDLAAFSGDCRTVSLSIVYQGESGGACGTSASSPLLAGMWARIQAAAPDQVNGLGFADPLVYQKESGATLGSSSDFFDVTAGDNGLHQASPGWDYVSGWGVPDVTTLMRDVDGTTEPSSHPDVRGQHLDETPPPAVFTPPAGVDSGFNVEPPSTPSAAVAATAGSASAAPPAPSPTAPPLLAPSVRAGLAGIKPVDTPHGSMQLALLVALAVLAGVSVPALLARSHR